KILEFDARFRTRSSRICRASVTTAARGRLTCTGVVWKKTLPDRFVRISHFAFRVSLPHGFQCKQRASASGVERAYRCRDVCQPRRGRFVFEPFRRLRLRPIQRTDINQSHAVEHVPYSARQSQHSLTVRTELGNSDRTAKDHGLSWVLHLCTLCHFDST